MIDSVISSPDLKQFELLYITHKIGLNVLIITYLNFVWQLLLLMDLDNWKTIIWKMQDAWLAHAIETALMKQTFKKTWENVL